MVAGCVFLVQGGKKADAGHVAREQGREGADCWGGVLRTQRGWVSCSRRRGGDHWGEGEAKGLLTGSRNDRCRQGTLPVSGRGLAEGSGVRRQKETCTGLAHPWGWAVRFWENRYTSSRGEERGRVLSVDWVTVEGGERVIRGGGGRWPRAEPDAVSDSTKIGDGEKS